MECLAAAACLVATKPASPQVNQLAETEGTRPFRTGAERFSARKGRPQGHRQGELDAEDNPLRNAPHTAQALLTADWPHAYSREEAAYPLASLRQAKYWSPVGRVDNVHGDRNLFCSGVPMRAFEE
jgi:hypothetical protein